MRIAMFLLVMTGALVLLVGCGGSDPTATSALPTSGETLFRTSGCFVCQGDTGQGGSGGPSIVHHSVEQVLRQV